MSIGVAGSDTNTLKSRKLSSDVISGRTYFSEEEVLIIEES
jgi:hypothetical protein